MIGPTPKLEYCHTCQEMRVAAECERHLCNIRREPPAGAGPFLFPAIAAIDAERRRQITEEGYTADHDDHHDFGELAAAASGYALKASLPPQDHRFGPRMPPPYWPFADEWWKPVDRRRDLIRAGALIVAEIERIDRADAAKVT